MSASGTKRTCRPVNLMSAIGGKADITCLFRMTSSSRYDGLAKSFGTDMKRRDFIVAFVGATAIPLGSPRLACAQQPKMPLIGFLHSASPEPFRHLAEALLKGLSDLGFVIGRDAAIEYRWAQGQYERLPELASDLVRLNVDVIVSMGGAPAIAAAKAATSTIPIVFTSGRDPVAMGLVPSLNRPGGNITGIVVLAAQMESKRLGLLREMVPKAGLTAVLLNPRNHDNAQVQFNDIAEMARSSGQRIQIFQASTDHEIDAAFARMAEMRAEALLVAADPSFNNRRDRIIALVAQHKIPAIYEQREFALGGGLASYGTNLADSYRLAAIYIARILKGEKPSDLPVMQSTKFEFVINLKTAKTLGLEISPTLLATADEAIE